MTGVVKVLGRKRVSLTCLQDSLGLFYLYTHIVCCYVWNDTVTDLTMSQVIYLSLSVEHLWHSVLCLQMNKGKIWTTLVFQNNTTYESNIAMG